MLGRGTTSGWVGAVHGPTARGPGRRCGRWTRRPSPRGTLPRAAPYGRIAAGTWPGTRAAAWLPPPRRCHLTSTNTTYRSKGLSEVATSRGGGGRYPSPVGGAVCCCGCGCGCSCCLCSKSPSKVSNFLNKIQKFTPIQKKSCTSPALPQQSEISTSLPPPCPRFGKFSQKLIKILHCFVEKGPNVLCLGQGWGDGKTTQEVRMVGMKRYH